MSREIKPKSLVQNLIQRVLSDAGSRIRIIDDNRALIAECETLAESIKLHGLENGVSASVDVFDDGIRAHVLISGQSMSAIRDAVKGAGLHIYNECRNAFLGGQALRPVSIHSVRIELTGLDCPIVANNVVKEISVAA